MVNGKMCVGIVKNELMCRIDPEIYTEALQRNGCRQMDFTGKPMKGFVLVNNEGIKTEKDLDYWVSLSLAFNKKAKIAKR